MGLSHEALIKPEHRYDISTFLHTCSIKFGEALFSASLQTYPVTKLSFQLKPSVNNIPPLWFDYQKPVYIFIKRPE
jgi:hypothetical protein